MTPLLYAVTDLGDLAVTLPAAVLLLVLVMATDGARLALRIAAALALCVVVTTAGKLLFLACGAAWRVPVASPSGHAAIAALVYGAWAHWLVQTTAAPWRLGWYAAAFVLAGAVAATRVALGAHNTTEALIGLAIGGLCVTLVLRTPSQAPRHGTIRSLAALLITVAFLHGSRLSGEPYLQNPALLAPIRALLCVR